MSALKLVNVGTLFIRAVVHSSVYFCRVIYLFLCVIIDLLFDCMLETLLKSIICQDDSLKIECCFAWPLKTRISYLYLLFFVNWCFTSAMSYGWRILHEKKKKSLKWNIYFNYFLWWFPYLWLFAMYSVCYWL